jgi:hypothetical protein
LKPSYSFLLSIKMNTYLRLILSFTVWSLIFDSILLIVSLMQKHIEPNFLSFCWFCSVWIMVVTTAVHIGIEPTIIQSYYSSLFPILHHKAFYLTIDFLVHYAPFIVTSYFQFKIAETKNYFNGFLSFFTVICVYFFTTSPWLTRVYFSV